MKRQPTTRPAVKQDIKTDYVTPSSNLYS